MDTYFDKRVAVVTGAGGTLCSQIAIDLAGKGCRVVLIGRTEAKLQKTLDAITANGGEAIIRTADVCDADRLAEIANEVEALWGACRFLINGAGGNNMKTMTTNFTFKPEELSESKPEDMVGFFDLDYDVFQQVLLTNTLGTVNAVRAFGKQMARAKEGSIINFASMNSYRPLTRVPAYAMSKAAVVNLTQWLATYFAPAGIRVNAVAPGFFVNERSINYLGSVETGLTQRGQNVINHTPMGRFGEAKELLGTVSYLIDDRAAGFVTGITLPVDGGFLSHSGI